MCYTGTCPYEGREGGCRLHDSRLSPPPGDAWCSEADYEDEPEDANFRRIAVSVAKSRSLQDWVPHFPPAT